MRVVVSLTTIPSRVEHLPVVFGFLEKQTLQPDVIYLALPKFCKKENRPYPPLPAEVLSNPLLKVLDCDDLGAITKLVPALEAESDPDTLVVTVDEDFNYPPNLLKELAEAAEDYPDSAIGSTGRVVGNYHYSLVEKVKKVTPVDLLQGCSMVAYRRGFFEVDELLDYTGAPEGAKYHDDIWISGYLSLSGVPRLVVPVSEPTEEIGKIADIQGLSRNRIAFVKKLFPLLFYFKKQGAFREKDVNRHSVKVLLWILAALVLIALIIFFLRRRKRGYY